MMHTQFFLRLMGVVIGIIVLFWIIGSLLLRDYQFETVATVNGTPTEVFAQVNELRNWPRWTSYSPDVNSGINLQYGERTAGIGANLVWTDLRGRGELKIEESEYEQKIVYQVLFGRFPPMTSTITLAPHEQGTQVTWSSRGRLPGGPFYGWFGMYFANGLQADYRQSLLRLSQVLERDRQSGEPVTGQKPTDNN